MRSPGGENRTFGIAVLKRNWQTTSGFLWEKLKPKARRMRHSPTDAEEMLWQSLRGKSLGVRFRRQHAIGRFIADFCCLEAEIVLEVDGGIHKARQEEDGVRDDFLRQNGFQVLRFTNGQVLNTLEEVISKIVIELEKSG